MQGTIPTIPTIRKEHKINITSSGEVQYLRDTQGNLILDTTGQPIREVDQT